MTKVIYLALLMASLNASALASQAPKSAVSFPTGDSLVLPDGYFIPVLDNGTPYRFSNLHQAANECLARNGFLTNVDAIATLAMTLGAQAHSGDTVSGDPPSTQVIRIKGWSQGISYSTACYDPRNMPSAFKNSKFYTISESSNDNYVWTFDARTGTFNEKNDYSETPTFKPLYGAICEPLPKEINR